MKYIGFNVPAGYGRTLNSKQSDINQPASEATVPPFIDWVKENGGTCIDAGDIIGQLYLCLLKSQKRR